MDPLFQLIANTTQQQRMQENTQRSSDTLRIQFKKELKDKGSRAAEMDSADLSADVNLMGEDLMGSMDPDLFGRSNAAFKQAWEEAEEEQKPAEEDGSQGEPDDQRSDAQDEPPPELPESPVEAEGEPVSLPPPGLVSEDRAEVEAPPEPEAAAPDVVERTSRSTRERPSEEDAVERSEPPQQPDDGKEGSGWRSLLDTSTGYLFSEETVAAPRPGEAPVEEAEEVIPELPPALAVLTSRLIVGDAGRPAFRRLEHLLSRFGAGVLRSCLNERVRVLLLPPGESLKSHPTVGNLLGDEEVEGAVYLPESRSVVVEESTVTTPPHGFNPVLYYFAHAFDHALGGEGYASMKSAAVFASFQSCEQALTGHKFADSLAGVSPVHYFAQAVESYLSAGDSADPLWTREDLQDFDRSMYDYVDYLLQRTNR
ncbi:MAG: hypothetical protein AB1758_13665 [Candidatus Eremiobacterota bacterium]